MKFLFTSQQIHQSLNKLFSGQQDKWAIVGFVGKNALEQLPKSVTKLSVVCWPKAGATHPDGVRKLLAAEVEVFFCNRMHSKVYWSSSGGMIIGSANLSNNALGNSGQHEFAVYLSEPFDIQRILSTMKFERVTQAALQKLDSEHAKVGARDPDSDGEYSSLPTFINACETQFPRAWKIVDWHEERAVNDPIRTAVTEQFGTTLWDNDNDVKKGMYKEGDFVLQVKTGEDGYIDKANCKWLRVEFLPKHLETAAIVQVRRLKDGAPPPFELDSKFKKVFKKVFNSFSDWNEIRTAKGSLRNDFIEKLKAAYQSG